MRMMFDITPCVGKTNLDCGPTCLRMLLLAAGTDVPLEQLTEECGIGFAGCTGADLLRVGRAHGLDMQSFSIDVEELVAQDRPAIVHWQHKHWVVFDGLDEDGRVWICNPSRGRYRVGYDTFAKLATGLADHPGQCVAIFDGTPVALAPRAEDNYAAGTVFQLGGTMYRAIAAIARGEAVTDANAVPTSAADEINAIHESEE